VRREGEVRRCGVLSFALMESAGRLLGVSRVVFLSLFFSLEVALRSWRSFEDWFCECVWEKHA